MNPVSFQLPRRLARILSLKAQLSAALVVAAYGSLRQPSEALPRLKGALKVWFHWAKEQHATPFWIFYIRMRACRKCPFYYKKLATCGSPFAKDLQGVGCWCHLPTKAKIIHADCYLRELGINESGGWPDSARRLSDSPAKPNGRRCKCKEATKHSRSSAVDGNGNDEAGSA